MKTWTRRLARFTAAVIASALALVGAEAVVRTTDGYALSSVLLQRRAEHRLPSGSTGGKFVDPSDAATFAASVPVAAGVERAWFALDPEQLTASPADPELHQRYWSHEGHELESVYEWNRAYVQEAICAATDVDRAVFRHLEDIYVFDAPHGEKRPSYRFLPATSYPSGLRTNAFGWRGADIDPAKPATKLRVAFVGASTTVGAHRDPFSYPDYVGRWLREWARVRHPRLSVDVINAGREGVDSSSIAAIVESELVPVSPDVVIYYEGANQFWPTNFVVNDVPLRVLRTLSPPAWLELRSALAARLLHVTRHAASDGAEPAKPPVWVRWPSDLSEDDPALDDPRLPVQLPAILSDLDRMRRSLDANGGVLALSSFMWLVRDGLVLDRARDALVFDYLNRSYWPFSYAHLRRYIDFENRVFRRYAVTHGLLFLDVAGNYPFDPRLFVDGIHMTPAGVKLHAWLVFQQLVPFLDSALAAGRLPIGSGQPVQVPPTRARRLVRVDDLRAACPPTQ